MGLQIQISADETDNSILVFDCTGIFSGENKGGYGGPNPQMSDIIESTLFIQTPSDTTEYPHEIDVSGGIPNKDGVPFEIFPNMIGQTEIDSGQYRFKLVHDIQNKNGAISEKTGYFTDVFIKNISCCIDKSGPSLDKDLFKDPKQKLITELNLLLRGAQDQITAGFFDKANTTIDYLKLQCKCSNC